MKGEMVASELDQRPSTSHHMRGPRRRHSPGNGGGELETPWFRANTTRSQHSSSRASPDPVRSYGLHLLAHLSEPQFLSFHLYRDLIPAQASHGGVREPTRGGVGAACKSTSPLRTCVAHWSLYMEMLGLDLRFLKVKDPPPSVPGAVRRGRPHPLHC